MQTEETLTLNIIPGDDTRTAGRLAYQNWRDANLSGMTQNAPGDDPDGDGKSNLLEYAAGTDPVNPASNPQPYLAFTENGSLVLSMDFVRPLPIGVTVSAQFADGTNFEASDANHVISQAQVATGAPAGFQRILFRDTFTVGSAGRRVGRIRVELA
jgi:hypothetical protein